MRRKYCSEDFLAMGRKSGWTSFANGFFTSGLFVYAVADAPDPNAPLALTTAIASCAFLASSFRSLMRMASHRRHVTAASEPVLKSAILVNKFLLLGGMAAGTATALGVNSWKTAALLPLAWAATEVVGRAAHRRHVQMRHELSAEAATLS